ncbi:MAG: ABC transporter ATP-binding protein/permease [Dysgonamonadaceae bacterium]|jgi:ABC-type multidrug transport system fused ATPase/permease subunit|nr:ABC transporter ATP-binding protein/permease [Dysgonamonadaceae bacterium]
MNDSIKQQLAWAWSVTAGYRGKIGLYMLLELVNVVLVLYFVYCSKEAIDIAMRVIPGNLRWTLVCIVLSVVLAVVTSMLASWTGENTKNGLTKSLQNDLAHSQMLISWRIKKRWHTGDLMVRLTSDCPEVVQMLVYTFPSLLVTCVKLLASLTFLWVMDPLLAQLILAISPLFLFSKIYYKKMRWISKAVKQAESYLGTVLQENLKHRSLIQSLLFTKARESKLTDAQESIFQRKTQQLRFSTLTQGVLKMTFNGGYLLAFLWGIYRLHAGQISYGTMAAFLQLVGRIQMPIFSIVAFLPVALRWRASIERLMELYEGEREQYDNPIQLHTPHSLKLHNVSFQYDEVEVIDRMSAVFQSGLPTAVTGASGKGKTTLIRLILALIKPDSGSLTLTQDGVSHEVSVVTRNNIAYVPQGNTLFCGTIRENLLLADALASEKCIDEALRTACAEFIYAFPNGMDTVIGESGYGLSEGQAQRIAIARALLSGGSIWLFDEPTSALDSDTVKQLISNLLKAGKDKILIFVTHDHQLTKACSQVVQLN